MLRELVVIVPPSVITGQLYPASVIVTVLHVYKSLNVQDPPVPPDGNDAVVKTFEAKEPPTPPTASVNGEDPVMVNSIV
jgi:hypothetical protein